MTFDFQALEPSRRGPKRHSVRLCECVYTGTHGPVKHVVAAAGSWASTLKDGRGVPGATSHLTPIWQFEGAVLHNGLESALLDKTAQMCHRIGENLSGKSPSDHF